MSFPRPAAASAAGHGRSHCPRRLISLHEPASAQAFGTSLSEIGKTLRHPQTRTKRRVEGHHALAPAFPAQTSSTGHCAPSMHDECRWRTSHRDEPCRTTTTCVHSPRLLSGSATNDLSYDVASICSLCARLRPEAMDKSFIFLAGHHRSGTSLLHEILRSHPAISGFSNTGVPEDEGQHLQSVYKPAKAFGGPGKYIFHEDAYMNESHDLARQETASAIMKEWGPYLSDHCRYYIEKSPPNLIRTRFLQAIFPESCFIVILRHPIAVSYATQKWSETSIKSLIEHSLRGYEIFADDLPFLNSAHVLRYEDFVCSPQKEVDKLYDFLGLETRPIDHIVKSDVNSKYFSRWKHSRKHFLKRLICPINDALEDRANRFGYSFNDIEDLSFASIIGTHRNFLPPSGGPISQTVGALER